MNSSLLGMIGLAMRAGKIRRGAAESIKAVREGAADLVILAGDASDETKKQLTDKCSFRKVGLITLSGKELLGRAVGSAGVAAIAVCDKGFARAMLKIYGGGEHGKEHKAEGVYNFKILRPSK